MKKLSVLNKLPKQIKVQYISDVGFLSYSPEKSHTLYDLKCEIEDGSYHLFYETRDNRYKLYFTGENLNELVKKMKIKLKNTSLKISKKEWNDAVEYAKIDSHFAS